MKRYNPKEIEPKWQQSWAETKIYEAGNDTSKPKKYVLEYFPYPSGAAMHVGHVRNYTIGDAVSRFARMRGYNVLHPMGWDAFGLPAENYAIKTGISPQEAIRQNTARFKRQLIQMGFGYDWSREFASSDPEYYRWTQWLFLLLYKRGLAYRKESLQWWCPYDKTVLANEQVENGVCWRCGNQVEKKALKQWFFKITEYADRLVEDLDDVDWSDSLKNMQRNWIGRSKGAEVHFVVDGGGKAGDGLAITVFTTRPDTLYGATFMVIAPEAPIVRQLMTEEQRAAVEAYIKQAQAKSDIERQETSREKTGVFTGAYAVNPVTDERIPIWVADYVLAGYGTGAVMAVPAHDERDYEFAKKFNLPVRQVIAERFIDTGNEHRDGAETVPRHVVTCIVKHPTEDTYIIVRPTGSAKWAMLMGGIEEGETAVDAARREIAEESGYIDIAAIEEKDEIICSEYFAQHKNQNRIAYCHTVVAALGSLDQRERTAEEVAENDMQWLPFEEARKICDGAGAQEIFDLAEGVTRDMVHEGRLINSGPYDGRLTSDARETMVADLEKQGAAKEHINYKIRDWLISRQRYWGAPIPIIHCPKDGLVPVPDDQLPVRLPEIQSFEPSGDGRSPLARVPEFVHTTCPKCGGPAERETDTMDGFACSSWYFWRYIDPHNEQQAFNPEKVRHWAPVDDYIGGAEHAVMHLLYVRFWTKVMHDAGILDFDEPIRSLRNHGMILAPDGQKMSKSKGNTIEPDGLIEQGYGADAIRIMELFIGPWNQSANWSVEGMGGSFRFLQRVWNLALEISEAAGSESDHVTVTDLELKRTMHRAIHRVSRDLEEMGFNTAIAALMETVNELYKHKKTIPATVHGDIWLWSIETLLQLLAPFAPHITEELWAQLGKEGSIHTSIWPKFDEQYLTSETMTVVVQVNGKLRGQIACASDATREQILETAQHDPKIMPHLAGKAIKKSIYVPGKLVNFVVT